MKKYQISVKEILEKIVEVEAESVADAIDKVHDMYYNEEVVLDSSDYKDTEIYLWEEEEN